MGEIRSYSVYIQLRIMYVLSTNIGYARILYTCVDRLIYNQRDVCSKAICSKAVKKSL